MEVNQWAADYMAELEAIKIPASWPAYDRAHMSAQIAQMRKNAEGMKDYSPLKQRDWIPVYEESLEAVKTAVQSDSGLFG